MNSRSIALTTIVPLLLLCGCAGTPATPPVAPPAPAHAAPAAPVVQQRIYKVAFDATGTARGEDGTVITRENVIMLLRSGGLDKHTVIKIEVPPETSRDKSIESFARAQRSAKVFSILGFDSVLVGLAQP